MLGLLRPWFKKQEHSRRAQQLAQLGFFFVLCSTDLAAKADAGIFASAKQKKGLSGYTGVGFSGSNFGRQVPGLHFAIAYQLLEGSFFTTGTSSESASASHQNLLLTAHALVYESKTFKLTNGIGVGFQHNTRFFSPRNTQQTNADIANASYKETDGSFGPGFSATACLFTYLCLRIESLLGLHDRFYEQIYHENAIASLGVQY